MSIDECSLTVDESYAQRAHLLGFWLPAVLDYVVGALDSLRPIHLGGADLNAKLVHSARKRQNFCDPDQGLLRYSPIIESGAAEMIALHDRDTRARHRGGHGRRRACRSAADYQQIEFVR